MLYNLQALLDDPAAHATSDRPWEPFFPSAVAAVSGAHCVLLAAPASDGAQ
ncbi:hypothetical protein ACFY2V_17630 [Streptomyces eurythermus]|uniref:hypothetical protein n=1 Tax=Streptomyces eurythermus TaxID=42237 RepID=UPI0036B599F1